MKRFIKTIDGHVYDTKKLVICEYLNEKPYRLPGGFLLYPHEITRSADDIIDLCDVFAVWDKDLNVFSYYSDYEEASLGNVEYEIVYGLTEYVDKDEIFHTRTVAVKKEGEGLVVCSQERH